VIDRAETKAMEILIAPYAGIRLLGI